MPGAEALKDTASGLLAVSDLEAPPELRPLVPPRGGPDRELGRRPAQAGRADGERRCGCTRASRSRPGRRRCGSGRCPGGRAEVEAAAELRNAIVGIVLRKAEELAAAHRRAGARSNQELEAFSYSVSHDLRAPFRHIVGYAELLREDEGGRLASAAARYLDTIIESARTPARSWTTCWRFSRMGRARAPAGPRGHERAGRARSAGELRRRGGRPTVSWKDRRPAAASTAT